MSNPYSSVSVSGYNSSPPADDGSAVSANQVKWSNHIDKIGGPLKTAIESINTNTQSAFAAIFGNDFEDKADNYTVTPDDQGKVIAMTADNKTFTLPAVGTVGANFCIAVVNRSAGTLTVDGNASETIDGAVTLSIDNAGAFAILISDGSAWRALVNSPASLAFKTLSVSEVYTSDNSLGEISDLSGFALQADTWYAIEGHIEFTQNGGNLQVRFIFTETAGNTGNLTFHAIDSSGVEDLFASGLITANMFVSLTNNDTSVVKISGVFKSNPTTGGVLDFHGSQSPANSNPTTVLPGSYLKLTALG